jgi:F0F1-type ATP synthase membrane subunit b/b'
MYLYLLANAAEALDLNYSLPIVMVLFIVYHLVMTRLFYRPLFGILEQREARTSGSMEQARQTGQEVEELLQRYENGIRQARLDGYEHVDQIRRDTQGERDKKIRQVEDETEELLRTSRKEIRATADEQKTILVEQSTALSRLMAERILHRKL